MKPSRPVAAAIPILLLAVSCSATMAIAAEGGAEVTPVVQASSESTAFEMAPAPDPTATVSPAAPAATVAPVGATIEPPDHPQPEQFDNPVLALMATINAPADGKGFSGTAVNYQEIFDEADIDPASVCDDKIAYRDALIEASLGQRTSATAFFNPYSDKPFDDIDDIERAYGFSFCDINATLVARLPTVAVHANLDPAAAIAAAQADERWADLLEVSEESDLTVLDWSKDPLAGFDRPRSAMFPFGSPGTLGISGNILVRSADLERFREAVDPTVPTLLETGSIRATVEAIIAEGSHQFHFSNQPYRHDGLAQLPLHEVFDADGLSEQAQAALARSQFGLPLWTSVAVGIARDAEQQVGLVVMSHLSETDAVESAARFEAMISAGADHDGNPWSDSYQVRAIRSAGLLMIAELAITDQTNPLYSLVSPLLTREFLYAIGDDPAAE